MKSLRIYLFSYAMVVGNAAFIVWLRHGKARRRHVHAGPDRKAAARSARLKIDPLDIYNPKGGGLSEAVVRLSIGCSAEFVSPEGLDPYKPSLRL